MDNFVNNDFNVADTNNVVNNNDINITNEFSADDFEKELNNINMSYVNDESNIVEPIKNEEEFNTKVNNDLITPQPEEEKKLFDFEPTFNQNIELPIVEDAKTDIADDISTDLSNDNQFNYDFSSTDLNNSFKNIAEESSILKESVADNSLNDMFAPKVEIPTIGKENAADEAINFTFDANGNVISNNSNFETAAATEINYNALADSEMINDVKYDEQKLNIINENIEAINKDYDKFKNIRDIAIQTGITDSDYLKPTFEKIKVYDEVINKLNECAAEYNSEINGVNPEKEAELTSTEF